MAQKHSSDLTTMTKRTKICLLGSCKIWVIEECELLVRLKQVEQYVMKR